MSLKYQFFCVAVVSAGLCCIVLNGVFYNVRQSSFIELGLKVVLSLTLAVTSAICFDIYRFSPTNALSYTEVLAAYKYVRTMMFHGSRLCRRDARDKLHAIKVQNNILQEILKEGKQTELGKDLGLNKIHSVREFRRCIPLSTYDRYASYVDRVVNGEESVLFKGKVVYLASTSGTTGTAKLYPKSEKYFKQVKDDMFYKMSYILFTKYPSIALKKICTIHSYHPPVSYGAGFKRGPVLSAIWKHNILFVVPFEGYFLSNTDATRYITLLFALRDKDIGMIRSRFAPMVLAFFQSMENNWRDLCEDVKLGRIQGGYDIPEDKLAALRHKFHPNKKRANELHEQFSLGFTGIAKRIWPSLCVTSTVTSGSFKSAADILQKVYLKGVPNYHQSHAGTEGAYGCIKESTVISLNTDDVEYDLFLTAGFFELLDVEQTAEQTILPQEAEIGKHYELIITTNEGLYRYRTTDVIQPVGFTDECLRYKFAQRAGDMLFLMNEKTPVHIIENVLYGVMAKIAPGNRLVNYTCTESVNIDRVKQETGKLAYWIFIEMTGDTRITSDFIDVMDAELINVLDAYRALREDETATKVKVAEVEKGTFDKLRDYILKTKPTTSVEQYKTPRILRADDKLLLLLDNMR